MEGERDERKRDSEREKEREREGGPNERMRENASTYTYNHHQSPEHLTDTGHSNKYILQHEIISFTVTA
jgi:hypothetical protein